MTAEQFVDALWQITGTGPTRAAQERGRVFAGDETKDRTVVSSVAGERAIC